MRIVTWNVNSMKSRLPRLTTWLAEREPDVVLLQETKSTDELWPALLLQQLGYESAHLGAGRWNGVAVLSRVGLDEVAYGLPGQPAFEGAVEPRAIAATCDGVRLWSVYVPNGRELGHPHLDYKLRFLAALAAQVGVEVGAARRPFAVLGDFNVAPRDVDVWDVDAFAGRTHVSAPERAALAEVLARGLRDLIPRASATAGDGRAPYTFWEMRQLGFAKGRGMRIDLALVNDEMAGRTREIWVDRDARKGAGPSDHAPLVLDLD